MTAYQCEDYIVVCDNCESELRINGVLVHFESGRKAESTSAYGWSFDGNDHRCPDCIPAQRDASDIYHSRLDEAWR